MTFTDRLFKTGEPVWESYLEHPFVKGIGEGTLDKEKFIHYMKQDYVYLIEYARVFAIGSTKANDLKTMTIFTSSSYYILCHCYWLSYFFSDRNFFSDQHENDKSIRTNVLSTIDYITDDTYYCFGTNFCTLVWIYYLE